MKGWERKCSNLEFLVEFEDIRCYNVDGTNEQSNKQVIKAMNIKHVLGLVLLFLVGILGGCDTDVPKDDPTMVVVTFDAQAGTPVASIEVELGDPVTLPQTTREDHDFMGWALTESGDVLDSPFTPSSDVTLYAQWIPVDWSDIEQYLAEVIPSGLSSDLTLPTSHLDYAISWSSSHPDILSEEGVYVRPYQATSVTLTATITSGIHSHTSTHTLELEGYKSLAAPLRSSYIYRNYAMVTESFFETLDIINCAFITADEFGNLSGGAVLNNIATYIMPEAKEHGNWVLFSVAPDSEWSAIVSSAARIDAFADNIVAMINQYGFDGVDIDWETPTPSEATQFTELMRVIHTKVKANNPNHLVTAAIAGGMWQPPMYDLSNSHVYLDYINMMTYGMTSNNGYYQNALYKSTVFDSPAELAGKTLNSCSIEESIVIYQNYGIPNNKIIVGVAFYGIRQTRTYNASTGSWSSWSNDGSVSFSYITNFYLTSEDWEYHYDSAAGVPYLLHKDGDVFVSYDNPRSIADKSAFILEQGLAGMMYWENGHDSTGTLLLAMDTNLND
jgi:chitinase